MSSVIERFEVRDFGPIRHTAGSVTPLHAFIGPNDSGKSSLLNAIGAARHVCGGRDINYPGTVRANRLAGPQCRVDLKSGDVKLRIEACKPGTWKRTLVRKGETPIRDVAQGFQPLPAGGRTDGIFPGPTVLVRLTSAVLLRPTADMVEAERELAWMDGASHTAGLAALGINALGRDRERFAEVEDRIRSLFPHVKRLQLEPEPARGSRDWRLDYVLTDGTVVPSEMASEGLLRFTAFALLLATELPGLLLVEEPENGLHPTRAQDAVRLLREISKSTQVLLATHSPVIVNALEPEEVSVVWRPDLDQGTQVKPIAETPNFEVRSKAYTLGDLWVSYADGETEAPLREPPDAGAAAE